MPKCGAHYCKQSHVPNDETAYVLKETDEGKNLTEYDTLDEFWKSLGFGNHS